ncbi:MAG: hypothetical protein KGQ51_16710, partial [Planctomycetes bacterium]|nr:hypothetical protein [Planctomycetota bacterium]
ASGCTRQPGGGICASRLLAMKLGFQWHKATGEPIEHTPIARAQSVPPERLLQGLWACQPGPRAAREF